MNNKIKIERTIKGFTQQQLADKVDVSRQTINAVEAGKFTPSVALAMRIANTLEKKVEEIFSLD